MKIEDLIHNRTFLKIIYETSLHFPSKVIDELKIINRQKYCIKGMVKIAIPLFCV